jgi:hypothetical protein
MPGLKCDKDAQEVFNRSRYRKAEAVNDGSTGVKWDSIASGKEIKSD